MQDAIPQGVATSERRRAATFFAKIGACARGRPTFLIAC
jgi:hypothetical protein